MLLMMHSLDRRGGSDPQGHRGSFWRTSGGEVGVSNSLDDGQRILGWGYQPALNTKAER
jgi:hypothetical protein